MSAGYRLAAYAMAAWLLCDAAQDSPAAAQIGLSSSSGEILAGQSSASASTTIVSQGQVFHDEGTTTATTRVGFNINADASPGLVAIEVGIASFDVRFTVDHAASFDLVFDFLLRGQVLRVQDQECQGSISLADIEIPTLVRVRDGAEIPLGVVLAGGTLDLDGNTAGLNLAGQDSRVVQFRGEAVETTAYRLTFTASATAISQSCEVSARFGADNGSTTNCTACEYPGFDGRVRDDDGLFVTLTVATLCGNELLDAGEECDFGTANGTEGACCDAFCRLAPADRVCRPAIGECDLTETCSVLSGSCPPDVAKAPGSPCTEDSSLCTLDACDEDGVCAHPLRDGTICANGECTCDPDGLFCTGPVRCVEGGGLCVLLPPPCNEDDTCDEERNLCVSLFATPTPIPNGTLTATPTPTSITPGAPTPTATSVTPGGATPTPTATAGICAGDCNGNRLVAVNELILGVNISLGNQLSTACPAFDTNGNAIVAINELIAGVNNALNQCRT